MSAQTRRANGSVPDTGSQLSVKRCSVSSPGTPSVTVISRLTSPGVSVTPPSEPVDQGRAPARPRAIQDPDARQRHDQRRQDEPPAPRSAPRLLDQRLGLAGLRCARTRRRGDAHATDSTISTSSSTPYPCSRAKRTSSRARATTAPRSGSPGDGDAAAAPELEQPLVAQRVQRAQHRVPVHAEHRRQVAGRREPVARPRLAVGDRPPELAGNLLVELCRPVPGGHST